MKLMEFKYTKANGRVSFRALLVTQEPQKNFSGYDITEFDETEFAEFIEEYRQLKNKQYTEYQELIAKHDLKYNYRQFIPENMHNVQTEFL